MRTLHIWDLPVRRPRLMHKSRRAPVKENPRVIRQEHAEKGKAI